MSPWSFRLAVAGCAAGGAVEILFCRPEIPMNPGLQIGLGVMLAVAGMVVGAIAGWLFDVHRFEAQERRETAAVRWDTVARSLKASRSPVGGDETE